MMRRVRVRKRVKLSLKIQQKIATRPSVKSILYPKAYLYVFLKMCSSSLSASLLNSFFTPFRILLSMLAAFQLSLTLLSADLVLRVRVERTGEGAGRELRVLLKRLERSVIIQCGVDQFELKMVQIQNISWRWSISFELGVVMGCWQQNDNREIVFNKIYIYTNKKMQRIPFGSPTKENITASPSKRTKNHLPEILAFLRASKITLPVHLSHLLSSNPESPLKSINHNIREEDSKKLRVQLSECEFQLKKVEEDFAEFKRQVKLEREKEGRKNEDQICKLKSALEVNQEDTSYKLQKMQKEHEQEKKHLKEKQKLEIDQEVAKVKETMQNKLENEEKLRKREVSELQKAHQRKLTEITKLHEEVLGKMKERSEADLLDLKLKHRAILEDKERRHESIRVALESQRRTEQKLHEKTKLQTSKEKEKLITQFCFERNTRCQLQEECANKQKEIRKLKSMIKDLQVDLQLCEQKWKKRTEETKQQYAQKHSEVVLSYEHNLKKVLQAHQQELSKFQHRITKMEDSHKAKIELLLQNAYQLSTNFELRPSKPEDLSEIDKLKWALAKKEEEVRKLKGDLKHCNLQLQNKEEIYTRIFRGNSMSREKKSTPKEDREQGIIEQKLGGRQVIFRKSQTADMKYLLKIYNNTKNG